MVDSDGIEVLASEQAIAVAAQATGRPVRFMRLDTVLAWVTELPAAMLVAVEILVLLLGVISRYVFNRPLTWSDELASILFLWLAMLGAVIALRRTEHMRLAFVVGLAPPRWRRFLETFGMMVVAVFLAGLIGPARDYVQVQWFIITPALEIHDGYRVAAIGVGAALMLLIALARLIERATLADAIGALLTIVVIGAGLWILRSSLASLGNINLLIFFIGMVAVCVAFTTPSIVIWHVMAEANSDA